MLFVSVISWFFVLVQSETAYHGYQVLRTAPLVGAQVELVMEEVEATEGLSFWKDPAPGRHTDIMASPELLSRLGTWLEGQGIVYSTMVQDVQRLIEESRPTPQVKSTSSSSYNMDWTDYHNHDEINEFLDSLASSNNWTNVINIGKSYEGRDMNVLAITKAGPGAPNVWLEAGIHAREWIAPAVATFIIRELVEDYDEHPEYVDNINWYLLPSANPDGYAYSWEHDRLWRKTRSDNGGILGCKGVDPNRNWDCHWGEKGVSHNRCQETYCGPEAMSEVETRNIRDFVTTLDPVPVLGHCFHSYSQLWLWPYGYDYNSYPENKEEIQQLAIDAAAALFEVHGTFFDPINSADLYPAAGASDDWYKGVLGTRFSFTTELRDTGAHGFILPKEQIIESGEEMWAGFEVVIAKILETKE